MSMRSRVPLVLVSLVAAMPLAVGTAGAQQRDTARTGRAAQPQQQTFRSQAAVTPNRDVVLEVPELAVDSIGLTVANVRAHVALDANAMNLVQVTAGVDVGIQQVQLGIVGVLAEAYLYVDLDNIARIVGRVVQTLDRNPEILTQVLRTVETAATSLTGQQPAPQPGQAPPQTTTPPTRRPR
jgi:hypothetical protein